MTASLEDVLGPSCRQWFPAILESWFYIIVEFHSPFHSSSFLQKMLCGTYCLCSRLNWTFFEICALSLEFSGNHIGNSRPIHSLSGSCFVPSCAVTFIDILLVLINIKLHNVFVWLPLEANLETRIWVWIFFFLVGWEVKGALVREWGSERCKKRSLYRAYYQTSNKCGWLELNASGKQGSSGWHVPHNYPTQSARELWYSSINSHQSLFEDCSWSRGK